MFIVGPFHIIIYIIREDSNQLTITTRSVVLTRLLAFWLTTVPQHCPHRLLKYLLQTLTSQGTALQVFALQLALNNFLGSFLCNRCCFWILSVLTGRLSQIDFIAHKYLDGRRNDVLDLRVPLRYINLTFFLALVKDEG